MSDRPPLLEIVVTARPSWARVRSLLLEYVEIAGPTKCRVTLIGPAVSRRYGDISDQIPGEVSVKAINTLRDSDDLSSVALNSIDGAEVLARHWGENRPDCVLVIADRTETLGVSCAASLMQIPLIHLQGGEVSGSIDDKVRDANTKLADLHLTTNYKTRDYLVSIGERKDLIRVVGCPSIDIVKTMMEKMESWNIEEIKGVGTTISFEDNYGIIMFHPDTLNEHSNQLWIDSIIETVTDTNFKWFWFWPNPDYGTEGISKALRFAREQNLLQNVHFVVNVTPDVFAKMALKASIMIGNSSFGIREGSFIGLPVINLGSRQSNRQRGPNVLDILHPSTVELKRWVLEHFGKRLPGTNIYGDGKAGITAAREIANWTPTLKTKFFVPLDGIKN